MYKRELGPKTRYRDLVACEPPELYDLRNDPAEAQNVYQDHPKVALELTRRAAEVGRAIQQGKPAPPRWRSLLPRVRPPKQNSSIKM
jgi:hypothetical protein